MKILVFFLALVLLSTSNLSQLCDEGNQVKIQQAQNDSQKIKNYLVQCIAKLVDNNRKQDIVKIETSLSAQQQKIVMQALQNEIKKLKAIEQYIVTSSTTCEPVIKWAQNNTHLFVTAKLSHRWDSPPCLKTISQNYKLINSTLVFDNTCLVSNAKINFLLNRTLFNSTLDGTLVKKDGVGTYSITIVKLDQGVWPALFETGEGIPLWEEVMERESSLKEKFIEARKLYQKQQKLAKNEKLVYLQYLLLAISALLLI